MSKMTKLKVIMEHSYSELEKSYSEWSFIHAEDTIHSIDFKVVVPSNGMSDRFYCFIVYTEMN